jgi:hypothetical protein
MWQGFLGCSACSPVPTLTELPPDEIT